MNAELRIKDKLIFVYCLSVDLALKAFKTFGTDSARLSEGHSFHSLDAPTLMQLFFLKASVSRDREARQQEGPDLYQLRRRGFPLAR